jgi:hypothetical protein
MIRVGRLAPANQWDQTMLDELFANRLYPTGLDFTRSEGYPAKADGCILLIPGQYWHGHEGEISSAIARYTWVLGVRTGDEEDLFDITKVDHPNIKWWLQTPRRDHDTRLMGIGFPPHFTNLPEDVPEKNIDVFLSGQNTHSRRQECFAALKPLERCRVEQTEGFTQGMDPVEYTACMTSAKVAPCPSGAVSPDSFRVYEALEAHAIPIADDRSPDYDSSGFWKMLFPDAPFPIITNYSDLPGWTEDLIAGWPANANRITAWWMQQKRRYAQWLRDDLEALGAL